MNLELHILQNFAPSNLNRDDTGSPKHAEFGGYRRARISSQAIKRAIRRQFAQAELVPGDLRAVRTKRVLDYAVNALQERGRDQSTSETVVTAALNMLKLTLVDSNPKEGPRELDRVKTQYLLFVAPAELASLVDFCDRHWDALATATKGAKKGASSSSVPAAEVAALEKTLDGGRAADLALFGRMLADLPDRNIDAASQVAHAISTHQVSLEFDYYTAVDDLKPEDTAGADMIGTVEFNSACYYRYANIDLGQLARNLKNDDALLASTVRAFLHSAMTAIPTGKQNSFAAQNPPSFVLAVVRDSGFWSLANAFAKPVRPRGSEGDVTRESVAALDEYWSGLRAMYGAPSREQVLVAAMPGLLPAEAALAPAQVASFPDLVESVMTAIQPGA